MAKPFIVWDEGAIRNARHKELLKRLDRIIKLMEMLSKLSAYPSRSGPSSKH